MSAFPGSPRTLRGAVIGIDPFNPVASIIVFQYNPATMTRSLQARGARAEGAQNEVQRLSGAPQESITVEVEVDATDQLERGDDSATRLGIFPQLSALEMLLYPKSTQVVVNTALMAAGLIEILPPIAPLVLFVWGVKRIVPVRISSLSITEEAFDSLLNPIRARVQLEMQVLTYNDFRYTHPGFYVYLTHQVVKETMAVLSSVTSAEGLKDTLVGLEEVGRSLGLDV